MKTAPNPIAFNPSKTIPRKLEKLSQITQIPPKAIIERALRTGVRSVIESPFEVGLELELMVGANRRYPTEKQAKTVASNFNMYAERMGWSAKRRAYVQPAENGKFRIRFTRTLTELRALAA